MKLSKKIGSLTLCVAFVFVSLFASTGLFATGVKAMDINTAKPQAGNSKTNPLPEIVEVTAVNSNTVCVNVQEGWYKKATIYKYPSAIDGQECIDSKGTKYVIVNAEFLGERIEIGRYTLDKISVSSADDSNFSAATKPAKLSKKRKTDGGAAQISIPRACETLLYIQMSNNFKEGSTYKIDFTGLNLFNKSVSFKYQPNTMRSDAVHVSQIGFNPADPVKCAYMSLWAGDGGAVDYPDQAKFQILNAETRQVVYEGTSTTNFKTDNKNIYVYGSGSKDPATSASLEGKPKRFAMTDVNYMDFSALKTPGRYVVYVEGVGCSYPFDIYGNVWENAFKVSMQGHLHQRSGIAFDLSFADLARPAPYLPSNGMKIYQSNATLFDSGNGFKALPKTPSGAANEGNFVLLTEMVTDKIAVDVTGSPNGLYGGYFDAGDWDRRIQHLSTSMMQAELMLMYPDYFKNLKLSLPASEANDNIPDTLNEILWNLDLYRRLQTADGGVRGGIEAQEHPQAGSPSWTEGLGVMAYAPDAYSSFMYASCAARVSYLFSIYAKTDASLNQYVTLYKDTAVKAFDWGTKDLEVRKQNADKYISDANSILATYKIGAEVELYRATGESKYQDLIAKEYTSAGLETNYKIPAGYASQVGAAYLDAQKLKLPVTESLITKIKDNMKASALSQKSLSDGNAFNIVARSEYTPNSYAGYFSTPHVEAAIRYNYWFGDEDALKTVIKACQSGAGANQNNLAYTSNLGVNSVKGVFYLDTYNGGKSVPTGITVYGPFSYIDVPDEGWYSTLSALMYPNKNTWPESETYQDSACAPIMNEYTIHETFAPTAFTWGYLAALDSTKDSTVNPSPYKVAKYDEGVLSAKYVKTKGLTATYYNSTNFTKKALSKVDSKVNFNWGAKAPGKGVNKDNFSVRWTGRITAKSTDNVKFTVKSTGGVRVYVNGKKIINSWKASSKVKTLNGSIKLKKGKNYSIKIEYFAKKEKASIKLSWTGKGYKNKAITNSNLYYNKLVVKKA